jgi:hypothetical protein
VFKPIHRENDIDSRIELLNKGAIDDAGGGLLCPPDGQMFILDIESDYLLGSMPGQLGRLTPRTASEVENNLAGNLIPDGWSEQRLELAAALVARMRFDVVPLLPIQNCRN